MKKRSKHTTKCAENKARNVRKTKISSDTLTYLDICSMAENMKLTLDQYLWATYWCKTDMIKLVKHIDRKLTELSRMAEKRANVEYGE